MTFPETITRALAEYDHKRKEEVFVEEHSSIIAVKNLAEIEQNNPLAILGCFSNSSERRPAETHLTYSVYVAAIQFVFDELFVGEKEMYLHDSTLFKSFNRAYRSGFMIQENFNVIPTIVKHRKTLEQKFQNSNVRGSRKSYFKPEFLMGQPCTPKDLEELIQHYSNTLQSLKDLKELIQHDSDTLQSLSWLRADWMTSENYKNIALRVFGANGSESILNALFCFWILQKADLFTPQNFNVVLSLIKRRSHWGEDEGSFCLDDIIPILAILQKFNLLTQENFDLIISSPATANHVYYLKKALLLTQENLHAALPHYTRDVIKTLKYFNECNLLTPLNREFIRTYNNLINIFPAIKVLYKAKILTQENWDIVKTHLRPLDAAKALVNLQTENISTAENRDAIKNHPYPYSLAIALYTLEKDNIATVENREAVKAHRYPTSFAFALSQLDKAGILTQQNRDILHARTHINFDTNYQSPLIEKEDNGYLVIDRCDEAIPTLERNGLLTQEIFDCVINHEHPKGLARFICQFKSHELIQQNLERLLCPDVEALMTDEVATHFWRAVPAKKLTQPVIDQLLELARQPEPILAINAYAEQLQAIKQPTPSPSVYEQPFAWFKTAIVNGPVGREIPEVKCHKNSF